MTTMKGQASALKEGTMRIRPAGHVLVLTMLGLVWCCTAALAEPIILHATSTSFGKATLELETGALVTMKRIPFRLRLLDADGKALAGARVRCNMDMPSMPMPENRPQVFAQGDIYTGEMVFTCAMGVWRVTFDAEHHDGRHQGVTFYVEQVRLP